MPEAICPYCREGIATNHLAIICPACQTPHHKDCWDTNKGCTVYACSHAPADDPKVVAVAEEPVPSPVTIRVPSDQNDSYKKCPYCGESIRANARKCRYCAEFLDAADPLAQVYVAPVAATLAPHPMPLNENLYAHDNPQWPVRSPPSTRHPFPVNRINGGVFIVFYLFCLGVEASVTFNTEFYKSTGFIEWGAFVLGVLALALVYRWTVDINDLSGDCIKNEPALVSFFCIITCGLVYIIYKIIIAYELQKLARTARLRARNVSLCFEVILLEIAGFVFLFIVKMPTPIGMTLMVLSAWLIQAELNKFADAN